MMRLVDVDLLRIMPRALRDDPFIIKQCECLDEILHSLSIDIRNKVRFNIIDNMTETELDDFAEEESVSWYSAGDSIETKREVLKYALKIHEIAGTTASIEMAVESVFGNGRVEEWHEYGGMPNHFKVFTTNQKATSEMAERCINIINRTKHMTAVLDAVMLELNSRIHLKFGMYKLIGDTMILRQVR